ncbi:TrkH family potassium uptake protein [Roseovarius amoyensis]|uniref:TrkH family potassium uptake protein n=1 Tax=Roseovarius amoyensis TaxID=2211448 RepID=UPI000DBE6E38|nr:TrkH family potassium uptake protein [Roseovarius amoyensis]
MDDIRPVGYIIGLAVMTLGLTMFLPLAVDMAEGREHWPVFVESALLSIMIGGLVALACRNGVREGLTIRQAFVLTTGVWAVLPLFGSLPFMLGETQASFTDAYFEAMSGVTTTGTTVFEGLDDLPRGLLMWRGILQWLGGLGIVIVALVFLPIMRVGGMQFFTSEGFDTFGKVLPRAVDISKGVLNIYLLLTFACIVCYIILGLSPFDATAHALTTISTGGFSTRDASFGTFGAPAQYAAIIFMILASMPFVRLMQGVNGDFRPFLRDPQARAYALWVFYAFAFVALYELVVSGGLTEAAARERLFNLASIFSGTGYGDGDVTAWGAGPFMVLILAGAIGGCTGSTGCSVKVFRYQILFRAIGLQLKRIFNPHGVFVLRYGGRRVDDDVLHSVMTLLTLFILLFGLFTVALEMTGLTFTESVTGAWTALYNIGPAFGPGVGPTGAVDGFPESAKWLMILAMLVGRLEVVSVLVLLLPSFWRN